MADKVNAVRADDVKQRQHVIAHVPVGILTRPIAVPESAHVDRIHAMRRREGGSYVVPGRLVESQGVYQHKRPTRRIAGHVGAEPDPADSDVLYGHVGTASVAIRARLNSLGD